MTLPKGFTKHRKYEPSSPLGPFIGDEKGFTDEILCPHGIGHEKGIHGCDGCCAKLRKKEKQATGYKNRMMTSTNK